MHPPGPENGKAGGGPTRSGISEKLTTNNADNIADPSAQDKPWPVNAETLFKRGILKFIYRPVYRDIVARCPFCGGRLLMDEALPNWICQGLATCNSTGKTFEDVLAALEKMKP